METLTLDRENNMSILAFDVHGVLDTYSEFRSIAYNAAISKGVSVYIISGSLFNTEMQEELSSYNFYYDKYFSITQEILDYNPDLVTWKDGKPYAPDHIWDKMKSVICEREKVNILFDDSPCYGKYFKDISTTYVEVQNSHWKESGRICKSNIS